MFPGTLKIDHVRVYQRDGRDDMVSCDPKDFPTRKVYREAYGCLWQRQT